MIVTHRHLLRRWRAADRAALRAICADAGHDAGPDGDPAAPADADGLIAQWEDHFDRHGFGRWAIENRQDGRLIGMTGCQRIDAPDHPMARSVAIAWWLARPARGQGRASEAAAAALRDGFIRHGLEEVASLAARADEPALRVMRAIGMQRRAERDFLHPAYPQGHEMRPHIVCTIDARGWMRHLATSTRCA